MDSLIAVENTLILTKKPIIGGNPATENNTIEKNIANV